MSDRKDAPPRKVVVGTCIHYMWGEYPGLTPRLRELSEIVARMADQARRKFGRAGLDLAVLPENAVTGCSKGGPAAERSVPLAGEVLDAMGAAARKHRTYIVLPLGLKEAGRKAEYSNAAVLLDRRGRAAGVYRKVHLVDDPATGVMEGGRAPGRSFPVFRCDFGRVGVQICYDMFFDDGWAVLGRKGAEIVAWPTMSPQTIRPRCHARAGGYHIVSSTWRNNASVFDPMGQIAAQVVNTGEVLAEQIDLEYVLLNWQEKLRNGEAFDERYGSRAGYRYSYAEDGGVFWSNDPRTPVRRMVRQLGLVTHADQLRCSQRWQDKARGGPVSLR